MRWLGLDSSPYALEPHALDARDGASNGGASPSGPMHRRELTIPMRSEGSTLAATPTTATALPTVYRAVTLLTHTVQQLDIERSDIAPPSWLVRPETYGPWSLRQIIGYWTTSLCLHGNLVGWAEKTPTGWQISPINPARLTWRTQINAKGLPEDAYPELDGKPVFFAAPGLSGLIWKPYTLIPGTAGGVGPIQAARQALGHALAVDAYGGDVYGNGIPQGVLTTDQFISPEDAAETKTDWLEADEQRIRVLGAGLSFEPFKLSPRDAAWLEAREYNAKDVARLFGIPAFMLDLPAGDSMTYQNTADAWNQYLRTAVMPLVQLIEDALNVLLPNTAPINLVPETLLKPTLSDRASIAAQLVTAGYDPASVADYLDLPLTAKETSDGTATV